MTEEYVTINGIRHFLLHYPKGSGAPVLLYLHGGPGSFESLFAYKLDQVWGDLCTHVHWDQRGAGKTLRASHGKGLPENMEQMLEDLNGVVRYLKQKYQAERILILGHSWGSVLGSLYALRHPENVLAYVGAGQVISMRENERAGYQRTLELAKKAQNRWQLRALSRFGDYPPEDPEQFLRLLPGMRKLQSAYERGAVSGPGLAETFRTLRRSPSFRWGDLVSFLQIMRVNRPLHLELLSFDLRRFSFGYQVPVHYIQGEEDMIAPASLVREYCDTVGAPYKTMTVLSGAGHNPMYEKPEEFAAALAEICRTLPAGGTKV